MRRTPRNRGAGFILAMLALLVVSLVLGVLFALGNHGQIDAEKALADARARNAVASAAAWVRLRGATLQPGKPVALPLPDETRATATVRRADGGIEIEIQGRAGRTQVMRSEQILP